MKRQVFLGEAKLSYHKAKSPKEQQIRSSRDAYNIFRDLIGDLVHHQECYVVAYLNRANKVLWAEIIHVGGATSCIQDNKAIVRRALVGGVQAMIVGHNHPSGSKTPSDSDRRSTKDLKRALDLFDISLLDHIIVCDEGYYSFADHGEGSLC